MAQVDAGLERLSLSADATDGASRSLTPARYPNNFPLQLNSFIGRERAIEEIKRTLWSTRLLTLTGPGGCGKTRLAMQVATDLLDAFSDGVWLIELGSLSDAMLIARTIMTVLDMHEQTGRTPTETLSEQLRPRELLLVVDNCEHVIDGCARLVSTLLQHCPNLMILATSREALNIAAEITWPVPPLSMTDPKQIVNTAALQTSEAARLFLDRATAAQADFAVSDQTAPAVAQICYRLDGMPLAIELAAARVKVLAVDQIAARLDDRFNLLSIGSRTAPARHQTLRAMIDWSYGLLDRVEKTLLRRLAIFAGGWTLEAAEAVCTNEEVEAGEVLNALSHLVDKSLVLVDKPHGEARYHLLETIRQYAHGKLLESAEAETIHQRHLKWLVQFAKAADPKLHGAEMNLWARRLDAELDNIRTALEWGFEHGRSSDGAELCAALAWYFFLRSNYREAKRWAEKAEQLTRDAPSDVYADALFALGLALVCLGEHDSAEPALQQALTRYRALGNQRRVGFVLNTLGVNTQFPDKIDQAEQYYQEALTLRRAIGDTWGITHTLQNFGVIAEKRGDYATAQAIYEEGLKLSEQLGDERMIARRLGDLGGVAFAQGDLNRADALLRRAVSALQHLGEKSSLFDALRRYVQLMVAEGQPDRAAQVLGAIELAREESGKQVSEEERNDFEQIIGRMRDLLGEDGLARAFGKGRTMTLEQAIEYALEMPAPREEAAQSRTLRQTAKQGVGGLTAREREVAVLIARGKANREIAEALVVELKTVEAHITHILNKLGFDNRVQIATWAVSKGLAPLTAED